MLISCFTLLFFFRYLDMSVSVPQRLLPSGVPPLFSLSSCSTPASYTQQPIPHFPESAVHSASDPPSPVSYPLYSPTSLSLPIIISRFCLFFYYGNILMEDSSCVFYLFMCFSIGDFFHMYCTYRICF